MWPLDCEIVDQPGFSEPRCGKETKWGRAERTLQRRQRLGMARLHIIEDKACVGQSCPRLIQHRIEVTARANAICCLRQGAKQRRSRSALVRGQVTVARGHREA